MRTPIFPGGKKKALTLSYDDGVLQDKRLISIMNQYGIKGTFNLNSGFLGQEDKIQQSVDHSHVAADEVAQVYHGHEVAMHTCTHPHLNRTTTSEFIHQIMDDRKTLEALVQYPVNGFAYPFGTYNTQIIAMLKRLNVQYARAVRDTLAFWMPHNLLEWEPTCHHNNPRLMELANDFLAPEATGLFYLWGHSYEFDVHDNWNVIEKFCRKMSGYSDVWYATNREIADYVTAYHGLVFADDAPVVCNPSDVDISFAQDGQIIVVPAGETVSLS